MNSTIRAQRTAARVFAENPDARFYLAAREIRARDGEVLAKVSRDLALALRYRLDWIAKGVYVPPTSP